MMAASRWKAQAADQQQMKQDSFHIFHPYLTNTPEAAVCDSLYFSAKACL